MDLLDQREKGKCREPHRVKHPGGSQVDLGVALLVVEVVLVEVLGEVLVKEMVVLLLALMVNPSVEKQVVVVVAEADQLVEGVVVALEAVAEATMTMMKETLDILTGKLTVTMKVMMKMEWYPWRICHLNPA
jgi:hypothetical protein